MVTYITYRKIQKLRTQAHTQKIMQAHATLNTHISTHPSKSSLQGRILGVLVTPAPRGH